MKIFIKIFLLTITIFFYSNTSVLATENKLKVGLLAPFSGNYSAVGKSILFSLQLALEEINDQNLIIIPRDSGSGDIQKLNKSIKEILNEGAKIIIGPLNYSEFKEVRKYKNAVFISPSNLQPLVQDNIISIGINLESQLISIKKFLDKNNKHKTVVLYPDNKFSILIEDSLKKVGFKKLKIFKYSNDPKILTGQIEKITNYSQRKKNLENRKKLLEGKDDEASIRKLKELDQLYTLGKVNFDSILVIDFGSSLKSVLASLVFSDVKENDVMFMTINQWFDKSFFYENSVKSLYYPSINYRNYNKFIKKYNKTFDSIPSEISILSYDALGFIYYIWKKNNKIQSTKDFIFKDKIKGKIGTFFFKDNKILQDLDIYEVRNKRFIKQ
ncbi:MAG: hypothetical protein CBD76_01950 [Pelagibacteraceae bacterium TMED216]|nr:MAG: hypothetical protein CBD76_01950 [Pelagibacteraceae bacterium TMED216]|tara:strand:- start:1010 stop:2164 length:1155 start_codon:yes stop_codon:yes gene_type:complete